MSVGDDDGKASIMEAEQDLCTGGLHLKPPKFEHIFVARHNFFPLSSVQILLIPACCLLCVL